jgi:hypothetical protein
MMDRFTKRAKQVLMDAKYEAQRFDHPASAQSICCWA